MNLKVLMNDVRACRVCEHDLPQGPRPLVQGSSRSKVLIIGQAPGMAAHTSGIPWDDRSGQRLRAWLGISNDAFYDDRMVALMPMGFCYPGKGTSGDLPPRPECAPLWHTKLLGMFKGIELTVYIGRYAMGRYLPGAYPTITDAVRSFGSLLPDQIVLPHPSPRNNIWLKKNQWFEKKTLPALQSAVARLTGDSSGKA